MGRAAEPPAAIPGEPLRPADAEALISPAVTTTATPVAPAPTTPSRSTRGRVKVKADSLLAARAEQEYLYVGEDIRRIVAVAAVLLVALLVAWFVFTVLDPFNIY